MGRDAKKHGRLHHLARGLLCSAFISKQLWVNQPVHGGVLGLTILVSISVSISGCFKTISLTKRSSSALPDLLCCSLSYWCKHLCGCLMNEVWGLMGEEEINLFYIRLVMSSQLISVWICTNSSPAAEWEGWLWQEWMMEGRQPGPGLLLASVLACAGLKRTWCTLTTASVCSLMFWFIWWELSLTGEVPLTALSCAVLAPALLPALVSPWLQGKLSVGWSDKHFPFCFSSLNWWTDWFTRWLPDR